MRLIRVFDRHRNSAVSRRSAQGLPSRFDGLESWNWPDYIATILILLAAPTISAEIVADGVLDEAEWGAAFRCQDWRRTEPYALDAPRYGNEIRIASTPTGLAAAFTIDHPADERRIRPRTPRDTV